MAPGKQRTMRTFGVEEELLLVDSRTRQPLAAGREAVRHSQHLPERRKSSVAVRAIRSITARADAPTRHLLTVELQQEQVEIIGPPVTTLTDQLAAIHAGRRLADTAARSVGGRAVALGTSVSPGLPHIVPDARYRRIQQHVGLLAAEQLTCGYHVHVHVEGREEGVAVLDRIRVWLPTLLALSANSPFWYGVDTGFASYRYQAWTRWPTAGACGIFGSVDAYDEQVESLLRSGVPLDDGMLYFDARLSARFPTVEVRIADVCMDPGHAAVVAALIRAIVEVAGRQWRGGIAPPAVSTAQLRAWSWRASRFGMDGELVRPVTGDLAPAADVAAELLSLVRPVLDEYGELAQVDSVVTQIVRGGGGARRQLEAFARRHEYSDVVDTALRLGTPPYADPPSSFAVPGRRRRARAG
jgi:carboxylate-amine ligase